MNRLACLLVLIVSAMLAGCSSIMRPPSAAAFMSSCEKDAAVVNMSLALYGGDLDNNDEHYNYHKDMSESHSEWVLDLSEIVFWNKEFFSIGLGAQSVTPFAQLGFVSPYFGLSAWSSIYSTFNMGNYVKDDFWKDVSFGTMMIQQIPVGAKAKIGLTEHFSRNGVERYLSESKEGFMALSFPEPHPLFYYEVGGGFFASYQLEGVMLALEFRYGRDLDNKRNRFAVTLSAVGMKGKKSANEKMQEEERLKNLEKEKEEAEERRKARELQSLEEYEEWQKMNVGN
ncbi:hypothetical protein SAMN05720758_2205 [Fibrobacter sp. UWB11]|nr:hypothetical protein SAMN05720758_2205 [Fibrobacter sp. UWB11]